MWSLRHSADVCAYNKPHTTCALQVKMLRAKFTVSKSTFCTKKTATGFSDQASRVALEKEGRENMNKRNRIRKITVPLLTLSMAVQSVAGMGIVSLAEETANTYYDGVTLFENSNGLVLGYREDTGVTLLKDEESGYYFKDMDKDGELDVYEDWRKSSTERAEDLASQMDLDQMLGLMLHDAVSNETDIENGKRFDLVRNYNSKSEMAEYNNKLQTWAENTEFSIPVAISTDPRHSGTIDAGYDAGEDLSLSKWPETLGMANSFSTENFTEFGDTLAAEYRALGFTILLGPQMDLITEPRWSRVTGAITEDYQMNADMANAYVSAMQTTDEKIEDYGLDEGWGSDSVSAIAKHWPSGGNGENGYDAHKDLGKFGVYPGDGFEAAKESFAGGAGLNPEDNSTSTTAAGIMPYYTISTDQDPSGQNVGNGFSEYLVTDLLRGEYNYEGVVCTDWKITGTDGTDSQPNTSWGLESGKGYTTAYRFYQVIKAGCDQIGGSGSLTDLKVGYEIMANGSEEFGVIGVGEEAATERIRQSAVRILRMMINLGIFENAYTDPEFAEATAGKAEYVETAYQTHLDSIVMIKNKDEALPKTGSDGEKLTVYIPAEEKTSGGGGWFPGGGFPGGGFPGGGFPFAQSTAAEQEDDTETKSYETAVDLSLIEKYYDVPEAIRAAVNDGTEITDEAKQSAADEADFAIVKIESPSVDMGTSGTAQNLQYDPYVSTTSRETSIGYDWYHADGTLVQHDETPDESKGDYKSNRSVNGMTGTDSSSKIEALRETIELMGDKPIIVILNMNNPTIVSEFEDQVDAILVGTTVTDQAYLETIFGDHEPTGLLAVTMPRDMDSVDASCEDIPDTTPYVDSEGNVYAFGFGLNWSGQISDERTERYVNNQMSLTGLDRIIDRVEGLDSSDYTEESWAAVEEALAAAKKVRINKEASQAEVDAAEADLIRAFGKLEYGVQKLHLETAIKAAGAILEQAKNFSGDAQALQAAVEKGTEVLSDKHASQEEVNNAAYAVLEELAKLAKKADISSLESLVDAAKELLNRKYTDSTTKVLEDAIAEAEKVISDQDRSDDAVSDVYSAVIDAIVNLEMKGNKAALKAMIVKAEEILAEQNAYVASTIDGLSDVLEDAKEVDANDNAGQDMVDHTVKTLTGKVAKARLLGDVNQDGKIGTDDSAYLLRSAAELESLDEAAKASADVNGDGVSDTNDAALIMQYAAEKVDSFR